MKTEVIICDNEQSQVEALKALTSSYGLGLDITGFQRPEKVLNYIQKTKAQRIYVLDIMLDDASGIDLGEQINRYDPNCVIIFLSADLSKACDVYRVRHCWFVYKPQKEERLKEALLRALEIIRESNCFITIHEGDRSFNVNVHDLLVLERIRRCTIVTTSDKVYKIRESFEQLKDGLPETFHQCHRAYLVNFERVRACSGKEIELDNRVRVPVSRSYQNEVKEAWLEYLSRQSILETRS